MNDLHVVLDTGALLALRGNPLVSRLVYQATSGTGMCLYAAACALVEADRQFPGMAERIAQLPAMDIVPLDLPAALALSTPRAVVATVIPEEWKGRPVRLLPLTPDR